MWDVSSHAIRSIARVLLPDKQLNKSHISFTWRKCLIRYYDFGVKSERGLTETSRCGIVADVVQATEAVAM
jgi:hypothetical protein